MHLNFTAPKVKNCFCGFDPGWPAYNEGNSVAALINVGLVTPVSRAGVVAMFFQNVEIALRRAAIVACEDDERVVINARLFQCGK